MKNGEEKLSKINRHIKILRLILIVLAVLLVVLIVMNANQSAERENVKDTIGRDRIVNTH